MIDSNYSIEASTFCQKWYKRYLSRISWRTDLHVLTDFTANAKSWTAKALGLGLGADDYITKPFSVAEVLARQAAYVLHEKLRLDNFRILEDGQIRIYDTHANLEDLSRTLVLHDVPVTALGRKAQTLESVAPIQGSGKSMLAVSINLFAHLIHIILTGVLISAFIIDSFKKRTMDLMFSYPIGRKKNPAVPDDLRSFVKLR